MEKEEKYEGPCLKEKSSEENHWMSAELTFKY